MPTIDVNGTTLNYADDGPKDAHALVCSPSMFFDTRMFAAQAEEFSDRYRVIRYDHRGQGDSARDSRGNLDMDTLFEDAAALIESLGVQGATFVGNSMGGFIGLRLAARRPDLIGSALLMGTSADVEEAAESMDQLAGALREHGIAAVLDPVMYFMLGDTTLTDPSRAEILAGVKELLLTRGPEYADSVWNIAHRKPVLDELADITVPLWVVAGSEDHTYPPPKAEQIANAVPGSRLIPMERTGHVHALENPDEVNRVLREHLEAIGR